MVNMKTKHFFALCLGAALMLTGCEEKELDSPEIAVLSPKSHEVIEDTDSVRIEAIITPKNTTVTSYYLNVKNKHGKLIFNAQRGCDCKSLGQVKLRVAFLYEVEETLDVFLDIEAVLEDGRTIREKIPFVLAE